MHEDKLTILRMYIYTLKIYIVDYTNVHVKDILVLFHTMWK